MKKDVIKLIRNKKGLASVEGVALLFVFVIFFTYGLGFFSIIHTGILNSIASRTYAFETFRNRTNLLYFRENGAADVRATYEKVGFRVHGVLSEEEVGGDPEWRPTERMIAWDNRVESVGNTRNGRIHQRLDELQSRETRFRINPVWIKTTYGICLDAGCGGD